ncbi:hypothetical protein OZ410_08230 [Robiginitalea sp. M366]|uniref:hypothetical protein n=1 Tax=Robiginitalea aestuariiviva TaxID=3036903 RepID=UPI00240D7F6F|nr:hypothetical protein [Robiginitalea aestuariiviva]MDG1572299.1 hypothetical protein [Robiginitalea aestuariiviva]
MVVFFTIFTAVVLLNALLLIFSTSVRFQRKNRSRSASLPTLKLKNLRLDTLDSEYRKAV